MKFGVYLPNSGPLGFAATQATLAADAESAGWDGYFIWDQVTTVPAIEVVDPAVALAAVALATTKLRIGALVTPLPRRRPVKFAREAVSLDHLSSGRMIVGVGLGVLAAEFDDLGEESDLAVRAEMLEEGLSVISALWRGERVTYQGLQYRVRDAQFLPPPIQRPRIPIWVAAQWPSRAPARRAAHWDGIFPLAAGRPLTESLSPSEVSEIVEYVRQHRPDASSQFDVVHLGSTPSGDWTSGVVGEYEAAGATWWLENIVPERWGGSWSDWPLSVMHARILAGPPRSPS